MRSRADRRARVQTLFRQAEHDLLRGRARGNAVRRDRERYARTMGECDVVWYVRSREWDSDPSGRLPRALEKTYKETERVYGLTGVQVFKYER